MAEDEKVQEETERVIREWVQNPYTQHLAREFERVSNTALINLISCARASTDPKVVKAVTQYEDALKVAKAMRGETKREDV